MILQQTCKCIRHNFIANVNCFCLTYFQALDLVRKLRLTQGLDIKGEEEDENEKDGIRKKILQIMLQVKFGNKSVVSLYNSIICVDISLYYE